MNFLVMKRTREGTKATKKYQIENRITPKAPRALLTAMAGDTGFPSAAYSAAHSAFLNFPCYWICCGQKVLSS